MKLDNTLFVWDLRMDLMPVGEITGGGFDVTFKRENGVVQNSDGDIKVIADKINGHKRKFLELNSIQKKSM